MSASITTQRSDAVSTGPIHENGILKRIHGQRPALPWWWRQAGLRTLGYLLHCRFPSLQDSALAFAMQYFVPITAAGQRRSYTGFPFNKLPCESLTCTPIFYMELFASRSLNFANPREAAHNLKFSMFLSFKLIE